MELVPPISEATNEDDAESINSGFRDFFLDLAKKAENGEMVGVVVATVGSDGSAGSHWAVRLSCPPAAVVGAIELAKSEYIKLLTAFEDEPDGHPGNP